MTELKTIISYAVVLWPLTCAPLLMLVPTRCKRSTLIRLHPVRLWLWIAYVAAGFAFVFAQPAEW
jgi:hypothetical protein